MTTSVTRDGKIGLPGGSEIGAANEVQRTELVRSYPELVGDFRGFLGDLAEQRQPRNGRIIIGIDELDKMASPEDAERFLNDLKAIFGVVGCYFIVSVSEDALTAFDRRTLSVRSTFDSAFDEIVRVQPLNMTEARELISHRGVSLPEPFLWLCQALSGGIPRDLLRSVLTLATLATLSTDQPENTLRSLTKKIIANDANTVLSAQLKRAEAVADPTTISVTASIAKAAVATPSAHGLTTLVRQAPLAGTPMTLTPLVEQARAYLYYLLVVWHTFVEGGFDESRHLNDSDVDLLAATRSALATSTKTALATLDKFRLARPDTPTMPSPIV